MKSKYAYWPISVAYSRSKVCNPTLIEQIRRAFDSRQWTTSYPHRYSCEEALRVHKAAALRPWHGWQIEGNLFGWTLHIGRLKVIFGRRSA